MRFEETLGLSYFLRLAEHDIRWHINVALKSLQLTLPTYSVLSVLEARPGLTNAQLARECSVSPQTMVRMLHSLEKEHLLKTTDGPLYSLTPKAVRKICAAHVEVNKLELQMVKGLGAREIKQFEEILAIMRSNMTG